MHARPPILMYSQRTSSGERSPSISLGVLVACNHNAVVASGAFPDSNAQAGREHAVPRHHGVGIRQEGISGQDLIDGSMRDTGQGPKFVGPFSIGLERRRHVLRQQRLLHQRLAIYTCGARCKACASARCKAPSWRRCTKSAPTAKRGSGCGAAEAATVAKPACATCEFHASSTTRGCARVQAAVSVCRGVVAANGREARAPTCGLAVHEFTSLSILAAARCPVPILASLSPTCPTARCPPEAPSA